MKIGNADEQGGEDLTDVMIQMLRADSDPGEDESTPVINMLVAVFERALTDYFQPENGAMKREVRRWFFAPIRTKYSGRYWAESAGLEFLLRSCRAFILKHEDKERPKHERITTRTVPFTRKLKSERTYTLGRRRWQVSDKLA